MQNEHHAVALFGMFGTGNLGNDGSLASMLGLLERVKLRRPVLCICGDPSAISQTFAIDAVAIYPQPSGVTAARQLRFLAKAAGRARLWYHAVRQLRRIDALIIPGTGVLDDFALSPLGLGWPHDLASWCVLARLMGVKVVFASVGAGPIHHPLSRWLMKAAARAAHYRSYRDPLSRSFMLEIGFDAKDDQVYPDLAFRLPAPPDGRLPRGEDVPATVGVGVMSYHGWRDDRRRGAGIYAAYLDKLVRYVLWLLDRGHPVRLLMGDTADRQAVEDVLRMVRAKRREPALTFTPARSLHDVMVQIAQTDMVVATRYHNVVCALRMGRPTISIGYARKNDALLAAMGLADFCQHIEHLDVECLKQQTAWLVSDRAEFERRVREANTHFEARLREQEERLAALIFGEPSTVDSTGPSEANELVV